MIVKGDLQEMGQGIRPTLHENSKTAKGGIRLMRADGLGSVIILGLSDSEIRQLAPRLFTDISLRLTDA